MYPTKDGFYVALLALKSTFRQWIQPRYGFHWKIFFYRTELKIVA